MTRDPVFCPGIQRRLGMVELSISFGWTPSVWSMWRHARGICWYWWRLAQSPMVGGFVDRRIECCVFGSNDRLWLVLLPFWRKFESMEDGEESSSWTLKAVWRHACTPRCPHHPEEPATYFCCMLSWNEVETHTGSGLFLGCLTEF